MVIPETEIIISRDGAELARTTVRPGDYVIGCHAEAEISIAAEGVAERHAQLVVNYNELFIDDLGSGSGTFVGGKRVTESTRLWPSQKVQIGSVVIETRKVKSAADSDQSLAPQAATVRRVLPEEFLRERKYEIGGLIAQGGMGAILDAHEATTQRTVAMKVMLSHMSESHVLRFIEEAQITSQLEHPNIVPVHELGVDEHDQVFYTMKLVQGVTLRRVLEKLRAGDAATVAAYPLRRLLIVLMRVCDAMAFAHSRGVIHRDLKPDNVMIGDFGEVLVMDWGLAKVLGERPTSNAQHSTSNVPELGTLSGGIRSVRTGETESFTMVGSIVGTPHYMSPEQARGESETLEEGSDIWALGAILRHVLTLEKPVPGETVDEVIENVREGRLAPIPPRAAHCPGGRVPEALTAVTAKAQALGREDRYASVAQFREEIDAWLSGFATKAEQAGLAKQLALLIQRHKGIFSTAAAAWLLITTLAVWFVFNLRAKEQRALAGEAAALVEKESTRRALATSQVAVADAAFRSADLPAMVQALASVPEDLRDQRWDYLSVKRDSSLGDFRVEGFARLTAIAAIPGQAARFAIADGGGLIGIVDVKTGQVLQKISTDLRGEVVLAITADGSRLAATNRDAPEILLFSVAYGKRVGAVPAPGRAIWRLTFSADGNLLAMLDRSPNENFLYLVEVRDGAVRWKIRGNYVAAIFSPDGTRLFAGKNPDRKFEVIGVEKGDVIRSQDVYFVCMALSRDGRRLAVGLHSGEVVLIDVATGLETQRARLHLSQIDSLTWTAGNQLLTVGGEGGEFKGRRAMRLWETQGFLARGTFFGLKDGLNAAGWDFNPESGHLLMDESPPRLWRIPAGIEAARFTGLAERGWATCFISDTVLLAHREFTMASFDVTIPDAPKEMPQTGPQGYLNVAPCWPAGLVALAKRIGGPPRSIKIYSTAGGGLVERRDIPTPERIAQMDWDAAGERLVAVTFPPNTGAFILDPRTGETLLNLPKTIKQAVFAGASGGHLAAIISKKSDADEVQDDLTLIDAKTGQPLQSVPYRQRVNQLVVSPDRRLVAIGGSDMIVRVLAADTLAERFSFRAHDAEITALAFHPKLPVLATASADGSAKLWDYATAGLRETFLGFGGTPVMLAFSPNGRLLSVEGEEKTTRLFDLSGESAPARLQPVRPPIPSDPEGWQDLLGALQGADVINSGHGWRMDGGVLFSPAKAWATLPLPGSSLSATSYQVRLKLRQLSAKDVFHLILPVADRMVGFDLDGFPQAGFYTALLRVNGKGAVNVPGALHGKQVKDAEPHDLEVTVRLAGANATITVQLDGKPLYEWTGPTAALSLDPGWNTTPPGNLALGTWAADWVVSEVKVKRLDAGK